MVIYAGIIFTLYSVVIATTIALPLDDETDKHKTMVYFAFLPIFGRIFGVC